MCTGVRLLWAVLLLLLLLCQSAALLHSTLTPEAGGKVLREVLAGRQVRSYRSYDDIELFHFLVPPHVSLSEYNFTANDSLACDPRNITIFLQAHSYPVINPDGSEYPPGFWVNRSRMYEVHLQSNSKPAPLSVQNPVAGDWFMAAFIDESSNRITQAGLFPSCHSWLQAEVIHRQKQDVLTVVPEILSHHEMQLYQTVKDSQYYRFYVPSSTWVVVASISNCTVFRETNESSCPVNIAIRPRALPDQESTDTVFHRCQEVNEDACIIEIIPEEEAWHYLQLEAQSDELIQLSLAVKLYLCDEVEESSYHLLSKVNLNEMCSEEIAVQLHSSLSNILASYIEEIKNTTEDASQSRHFLFMPASITRQLATEGCWPRQDLVKKTFSGSFVFEYDLPPNENGSVPLVLNITNTSPTILTFNLEPVIDIGGTLVVELALPPYTNGNSSHNTSVVGCVTLGRRTEPDESGKCTHGHQLLVNTTSHAAKGVSLPIPFPEPGLWYLTLRPWCHATNASEPVECSGPHTSVLFRISSAACLDSKCGDYGYCDWTISAGFIFSYCVCEAGYRGWGCTDSSEATPNWELLLATLLLTLSNLFFLPAIILAFKRRYFAEALVYMFTMVFSTFYHACDQEVYNYCLIKKPGVLQFCDFYSAIFSFWVTLIAMADLPHSLYSLLHVAGAMVVALGVEYNKTGLLVFVVPSVSAFLVMTLSWIWHCKEYQGCFPSKKYWLTCLLPGVLLAAAGLICYAFFETHDNYQYVHSVWHATMALAILCLLPPRREKEEMIGDGEEVEPLSGCEVLSHNAHTHNSPSVL